MAHREGRREAPEPFRREVAATVDILYRRHSAWLARMLTLRLKTTSLDVEDIVQETYVRVARYAPADAQRHPRSLLMRIAVNLARDHMRRNAVRGGLAAELPADAHWQLETAAGPDQEHALAIKQVILSLPPIYRDVFVLSRFTGLTYEEIASHVGISAKAVEWRMSKALAMCAAGLRD